MKRYTVGSLVLGGFSAALAVIALMVGIAWHGMTQSEKTAELVGRTHDTRIVIGQIIANMHSLEANHRGFLLSGDQDFLLSRDVAFFAMQEALRQVSQLTYANTEQQVRVRAMQQIIGERMKLLHSSEAYRYTQGLEGALRQYGSGGALATQMRDIAQQMRLEEEAVMRQYQQYEADRMALTRSSFMLMLALFACVLFFISMRIRRDIRRQDQAGAALRQSEATLKQILDLLPVGVHVTDDKGNPVMVNPAARRIWSDKDYADSGVAASRGAGPGDATLGWQARCKATWLGTGKIMTPEEWGLARALKNGEVSCNEALEIKCMDGSAKVILNSAMPLRDSDGRIVGGVTVSQDVTDLTRTEQSLRKAHDELELRVRQRTAELEQTNRLFQDEIAERRWAEQALQQSQKVLRHFYTQQEYIKEEERKRIAREIHDELGQNLLALRIDISMLHARTTGSHPILNKKVARVLENVDATVKSVRAIINNLRPSVLDLGLFAAIEWQVNEFKWRTGIMCTIECAQKSAQFDSDLDDNRATGLFRILQESLTNVARHAHASQVNIFLHREGTRFTMRISDDGIGIQPDSRKNENSFGLVGIEERVHALGGTFVLESSPGRGTSLTVTLPVLEWHPAPALAIQDEA